MFNVDMYSHLILPVW